MKVKTNIADIVRKVICENDLKSLLMDRGVATTPVRFNI